MLFEFVAVGILAFLIYYVIQTSKGSRPAYWKEHGIKHIDSRVAASNLEIFMGKRSIMHRDDYAYHHIGPSEKFCGMPESPTPVILLKDLELIKKIMIKDFDHFVNRRDFFPVAKENIISQILGFLKGDTWKGVRTSMSRTLTTGKIRRMMEHFNGVGQEWTEMLKKRCDNNNNNGSAVVDVLKTVSQYTVEVIASTVFGVHSGTVQNPESTFNEMADRLAGLGWIDALKLNLSSRLPGLFLLLGIEVLDPKAIDFFENLVRQGLEARLSGSVEVNRNDFQQILIEAQKGQIKALGPDELSRFEKEAQLGDDQKGVYLTNDVIVANSVVFFLGGLQTTGAMISFAIYALAAHPDIQDKLKDEVGKIMKEDGSLDYDELGQLAYTEMFTSEVLRKYPAAIRLEREAVKNYHDKESGLFVPKGTTVVIPVNAIHHDSKYYPNPERFDPENFSAERKAARSPYSFLTFGVGPRNCIGMRFALIEAKVAIAHVVHNFKIEPTANTPLPVYAVPAGVQLFTPKDLEVKLTSRRE